MGLTGFLITVNSHVKREQKVDSLSFSFVALCNGDFQSFGNTTLLVTRIQFVVMGKIWFWIVIYLQSAIQTAFTFLLVFCMDLWVLMMQFVNALLTGLWEL